MVAEEKDESKMRKSLPLTMNKNAGKYRSKAQFVVGCFYIYTSLVACCWEFVKLRRVFAHLCRSVCCWASSAINMGIFFRCCRLSKRKPHVLSSFNASSLERFYA
ncbi:hypothetical protein LZ30DRAFT_466374 [Colletotrichum cereale]|nr:hypothetical protein LZ30DRAFT_466374 [Colletotrichum cereale]